MKHHRAKALLRRAISVAYPGDSRPVMKHLEEISKLSMDEIEELMQTRSGMRRLRGRLRIDMSVPVRSPKFDEVVEATPGRLSDEEFERVLSGGTPH